VGSVFGKLGILMVRLSLAVVPDESKVVCCDELLLRWSCRSVEFLPIVKSVVFDSVLCLVVVFVRFVQGRPLLRWSCRSVGFLPIVRSVVFGLVLCLSVLFARLVGLYEKEEGVWSAAW
jgi:hypothetical protein